MSDQFLWEGFSKPDSDYFKISNSFVDALALIDNMAELKVILYVMRHTWGFQEYEEYKHITLDEFVHGRKLRDRTRMDAGTGMGMSSVKSGVDKALEHGFLECEIDDYDLARIKKCYRLKLKSENNPTQEKPELPAKPKSNTSRLAELKAMPYAEYLQSPEWAAKRLKALRFAGFKCQLCNSNENLNVHHRTYERRGHELMGDLTVLCSDCHTTFTYNRELAK